MFLEWKKSFVLLSNAPEIKAEKHAKPNARSKLPYFGGLPLQDEQKMKNLLLVP